MENLKDSRASEGVLLYLCRGGFWRTLEAPAPPLVGHFSPCVFVLLHQTGTFSFLHAWLMQSPVGLRCQEGSPPKIQWSVAGEAGLGGRHKEQPLVITGSWNGIGCRRAVSRGNMRLFKETDEWWKPETKWKSKIPKGQSRATQVSRSSQAKKTQLTSDSRGLKQTGEKGMLWNWPVGYDNSNLKQRAGKLNGSSVEKPVDGPCTPPCSFQRTWRAL